MAKIRNNNDIVLTNKYIYINNKIGIAQEHYNNYYYCYYYN